MSRQTLSGKPVLETRPNNGRTCYTFIIATTGTATAAGGGGGCGGAIRISRGQRENFERVKVVTYCFIFGRVLR